MGGEGARRHEIVKVLDFDNPDANEFVAVNQFTVVEAGHERRPDIVLFVNGLPVAVIELKNAATENATIWTVRENVRAKMRVIIKRILRKYGYPPDKQAQATELVLAQAEVLCKDWSNAGA